MRYAKSKTAVISFPLGGVGSGCIGLAGNGALVDWEIFNRANKGSRCGLTHFCLRAEQAGKVLDFRLLNGDLQPPYTGSLGAPVGTHSGFGWGPAENTLCNWPHFRKHSFLAKYPFASVKFAGEKFPAKITLNGWSVLVPGEARDSSLPAAFLEIEVSNTMPTAVDFTAIGVLDNPWSHEDYSFNTVAGNQLTVTRGGDQNDFLYGDLTLTLDEKTENISFQEYFFRGSWRDHQESYYYDLQRGGRFVNRHYENPLAGVKIGLLATHFSLQAGETRKVRFVITWNVPNRRNDWRPDADQQAAAAGIPNRWKNYYATQWRDSQDSGQYALREYDRLQKNTRIFAEALFASTIPKEMLEAVSANISLLKSPTCLRLQDGTFYGWEGVGQSWGSCEGSCSHVWNYAQVLPFLFPELERSMRASHLKYSVDEFGACRFRLQLPLGIKAKAENTIACVDGQFGDVMKIYRDWKISGDEKYLKYCWPTIKRTIEYAWSPNNIHRWDPQQSGILTGRQHNTLDIELFGPNAWLTGHYLGALLCGAELAAINDDHEFASLCRKIYRSGRNWLDKNLFNGEYYCQKINIADRSLLEPYENAEKYYWDAEHQQIRYQIADGCGIDAVLAQCYAHLYGIGEIFAPEQNLATLQAIFKYNYRPSMRDETNLWRNYSLNDEGGVWICTWPHGNRPVIPICYNSETMHGFEYAYATHLLYVGMLPEAVKVVRSIREHYDGCKRNPWNEMECGSNYARSMASYGLLVAYAGFKYDIPNGMLGFAPASPGKFQTFWSLGHVWGTFARADNGNRTLKVLYGKIVLKTFLAGNASAVCKNSHSVTSINIDAGVSFPEPLTLSANDTLTLA